MKKKYLTLIVCLAFILCAIQLNAQKKYEDNNSTRSDEVQRVYIDFTSPEGAVRHLLLGFTPNNEATDGFDFGYDAPNADVLPDDLNWIIEDDRYIIQGVGAFEDTKSYPFGMYLEHAGDIKISLVSLENFEVPIDVFVHDTQENTYTKINEFDFNATFDLGEYINRIKLAFKDPTENLSVSDYALDAIKLNYQKNNNLLIIDAHNIANIEGVNLYSVHGQKLLQSKYFNDRKIQLALNSINHDVIIVGIETSKGISHRKIALLH
jgi:hypothetical protein